MELTLPIPRRSLTPSSEFIHPTCLLVFITADELSKPENEVVHNSEDLNFLPTPSCIVHVAGPPCGPRHVPGV